MLIKSLVSLAVLSLVSADDEAAHVSTVPVITADIYDGFIKADGISLVKFYAPWCGHCKTLAPEFEKAANLLKESNIRLATVDCTIEAKLCENNDIKGYPTLKIFRNGVHEDYKGPRKAEGIVSFMKKQLAPSFTILKNVNEFNTFKDSEDVVIVGFFNAESEDQTEFKNVAEKMRNDFSFAIFDDIKKIPIVLKKGGKSPQVVLFKKSDNSHVEFEGKVSVDELAQFIAMESLPLVGDIGPENYKKYVDTGLPLAFFFYADEDMKKSFNEIVENSAKIMKGKANTVFINSATFGKHAESLNMEQKWPAFVIHDIKTDLKYPFSQAEEITKDAMTAFAKSFASGKLSPKIKSEEIPTEDKEDVKTVVNKSFDNIVLNKAKDVLVEFYAPWCSYCQKLAPDYEKLAKMIAGITDKIVITKFNGAANDLPSSAGFTLEHFPTLKLYKADTNELVSFSGNDMTLKSIYKFLEVNSVNKSILPPLNVEEEESVAEENEEDEEEDGHEEL